MYVFFLLTWSRSYWEPPKFTFKSFFCMPDTAFEVVCPSPQGSRSPGLYQWPHCVPPITGSVSEPGGHGVGGAGPQGLVPPNGKSSDVSSVDVSGAQAGQMSPLPPSLNTPFCLPRWPSDVAHGVTAGFVKVQATGNHIWSAWHGGYFYTVHFFPFLFICFLHFFSLLFLLDLLLYYSIFKPRHTFPSDFLM